MSPADGFTMNNAHPGWHTIRPWTPPLSLFAREVTSVSATFILASTVSDINNDLEPSLAALGLNSEDNGDEDHTEESNNVDITKHKSIISDALANGVSVNVNGSPWQRVVIRIDDMADEAVIIIWGLMPGRLYDIDLSLVQGDKIRRQVVTQESEMETPEGNTEPDSFSFAPVIPSDPPLSTSSTPHNRTFSGTPPQTSNHPLTLDERLSQLQHSLILINVERENLAASLKSARRDGQKSDAALRSEIETLKRASEKHSATEHRMKQKILALQEALKRAQVVTREAEELVREVEGVVPELSERHGEKEAKYSKIQDEADKARREREKEEEKEKKRVETMKNELAGLSSKLERLNGKREKLETGSIPDLEEQLKEVEREIEKAECANSHPPVERQELNFEDFVPGSGGELTEHSSQNPQSPVPVQRRRLQSSGNSPGTIGRPSPSPIQRPVTGDLVTSTLSNLGSTPHAQMWSTPQRQTHNLRSSSLHQQTPVFHANWQRRGSLKSTTTIPMYNKVTTPPSLSSSPPTAGTSTSNSISPLTTSTSTLSSHAPAFEPGRTPKTTAMKGYAVSVPIPIHRPPPGATQPGRRWRE